MGSNADLLRVIAASRSELDKPGVLTVRPGVQAAGGWLTRRPAIVVTLLQKAEPPDPADCLPEMIGGYPVDVRQASDLQRLRATSPSLYAQVAANSRPETRLAEFADETTFTGQALLGHAEALAAAAVKTPEIAYTPPQGVSLEAVEGSFTLLCHASPDAGWPTLSAFLDGVQEELTVGLYDFTSAHILDRVNRALAGKKLNLVLDHPPHNPTADQTDEDTVKSLEGALGDGFVQAWALENADPFAAAWIYPNAYHIKVAVRDKQAFWLSSGNWNNSNQPDIDPVADPEGSEAVALKSDRDWHVIVTDPGLATTFAAYLENDLAAAQAHQTSGSMAAGAAAALAALVAPPALAAPAPAFKQFFAPQRFSGPMTLQPLLTPDPGVYAGAVLKMITDAQTSVYIQTQYVHVSTRPEDAAFAALVEAVAKRQRDGLDVRIILSEWETLSYLEQLQAAGVDLDGVRIQQGVHNKGIICDSRVVLVSSQNWSGDGVLRNRDAGLIIASPDVAAYYEAIFLHDWTNLATKHAVD